MREGSGASHATGKPEISMPEDIAIAERAVLNMDSGVRQAIKYKYIQSLTDKDGTKKCRCGRTEYRNRLERGIMFLAGWLAAT